MSSVIERAKDWLDASAEGIRTPQYANALIAELLAIVERLPQTADGVPVVPGGVYYFEWNGSIARGVANVEVRGPDLVAVVSVVSSMFGHTCRVEVLVCDCYSTRAAAEAARAST